MTAAQFDRRARLFDACCAETGFGSPRDLVGHVERIAALIELRQTKGVPPLLPGASDTPTGGNRNG